MKGASEQKLRELAAYLDGFAAAADNPKIREAATWLDRLASHGVCGQGFLGCYGGDKCSSDHK